jgi:hypothetical protein
LKPGAIGDKGRLAALPTIAAMLSLFQAEHNLAAGELAARYPTRFGVDHPDGETVADEECFQAARAVTIATFILIIQYDYLGSILGHPRWAFERFTLSGKPYTKEPIPLHTSVEFRLIYQFHTTIPEKWAAQAVGTPIEELLTDAMHTPSGRFGARHTPAFLRGAEIGSIEWGRQAGMCSYNDLRECFGLARRSTWGEVNGDPDVQATLAALYPGGVEDLELYVGCSVEEHIPESLPGGAGWSLPQTLFSTVQGDAIAAGIGDRFHTRDFTAEALTEWGYAHALKSGRLSVLVSRHTSLQVALGEDLFHIQKSSPPSQGAMTDDNNVTLNSKPVKHNQIAPQNEPSS